MSVSMSYLTRSKKSSTVVFDIDGTLANNDHRRSFVESSPKDWKTYNKKMNKDTLFKDIANLLGTLSMSNNIVLCTGREEVFRTVTEDWLDKYNLYQDCDALYMRKEKDYRPDSIVKVEMLKQVEAEWSRPWLWFDDRKQVVDAIRAQGIRVLQVQEGNF